MTDAEQVRRVVEEVLARPEYRDAAPSLLAQLRLVVLDFLGRLVAGLTGSSGGSLAGALVLVAAAVLVAVLVARFARAVRRDPEVEAVVSGAIGRSADDWRADAAGHERAGRWREALRAHYRALLADLAAVGLVEEVPGRTTGEYLSTIRAAVPAAATSMTTATVAFDSAWYGEERVTPEAVAAFLAHAGEVRRAAGLRVRAGAVR